MSPSGHRLSRRGLLGGLGMLGGGAALSACGVGTGTSGPTETGVEAEAGPWRWTDAYGQDVELAARPTRIVAFADQAAALLGFGIRPVGLFAQADPASDPAFADVDLDGIEVLGVSYGEIDVESLVALQPDLVVTTAYTSEDAALPFGFRTEGQARTVREIAPIVGVLQDGTALDVIGRNAELAASLGVDVEAGAVAESRAEFEDASEELRRAARSGLVVAPVYAETDGGLWFAKAPDDPALAYYAELGVRFVEPEGGDYYWEQVSWENADLYPSDVVMYSLRYSLSPEELLEQPTFAARDAARAGQLRPWTFRAMDHASQAANMREIAAWLSEDEKVV